MKKALLITLVAVVSMSCASNFPVKEMDAAHDLSLQGLERVETWHEEVVNDLCDELLTAYHNHLSSVFQGEVNKLGTATPAQIAKLEKQRNEQWLSIKDRVEATRQKYMQHPDTKYVKRLMSAVSDYLGVARSANDSVEDIIDIVKTRDEED